MQFMKAQISFFILFVITALLVGVSSPLGAAEVSTVRQAEQVETPSSMGYYLRGIIPGWGQYYAGYKQKGIIFLGSFGLSGGLFTWSLFYMTGKKQAYNDLGYLTDQAVFDKKWKEYRQAGIIALVFGLVFGAVYTASWVDLIFFSDYTGKTKGRTKVKHAVHFEGYQEVSRLPYHDARYGIKLVYTF